jgi:hypothetical protein
MHIYRVLTQNASLHTSYLSFLKQSGSARHLTISFTLPEYVQDVYFFCTVARQVYLNSQVLTRVAMGGQNHLSGEKKTSCNKYIIFSTHFFIQFLLYYNKNNVIEAIF